jgi:hypothetical protein
MTARGARCRHGSARNGLRGRSPGGSVADPDLTPSPAASGVNVPILEACAVIGVIAEVGVAVVVIAREVTVRAEEASAKAAASIVVAVEAVVSIVVAVKVVASIIGTAAKAGAVRFGPAEAARPRTSEPSHGAAAGTFATKSATDVAAADSSAHFAASQSSAHLAATKSSAHVAAATTATKSSASAMTAAAATTTASKSSASAMTAATAAAATANKPAG